MNSRPPGVRIYRALLRAYPPSFRERHGPEMVRAFGNRLEEVRDREGALGLARLRGGTLLDVTRNAMALRWAALRDAATAGPGLHEDLRFRAVAAGACFLPALRATRVDPATALREE